ncbi:hypothetical protein SAMN05444401_1559 [Clostridium amylolyticum]|uniref:YhfM-like domain-containing protein n=1 Tax=Clostridium amylolyticum TaxID=1121298 RepID=A0A1M6EFM8_9CLOT|nr:hypothetical protein [Clostridium amylolyticum]SHI84233.1 hypothetical protein SAMN05444401_1559 [Clostridium amylolyticum]
MKKNKLLLLSILLLTFLFSGCNYIDNMKVKLKMKNQDFEYIKQGKVEKIVIQSTRDNGFRFVVTDKSTIRDLYGLLSTGKEATENSNLSPDYIFEFQESADKIHKFNYVAGLNKKGVGNFYDGEKSYSVNKRLDNDIIRNMYSLRRPKDFSDIYYASILKFLSSYGKNINSDGSKSLGINIKDDIECAKYVLSVELEDFKYNLNSTIKNAKLVDNNKEDFDILVSMKTQGYKTTVYKSIITLYNKSEGTELKYYVLGNYENREWTILISESRPEKW